MHHFDDYQLFTDTTAIYPLDIGLPYSTLGLLGESGEYAEKIFNLTKMRKATLHNFDQLEPYEEFKEILKQAAELGRRAENLKKALRRGDKKIPPVVVVSTDERDDLVSELGDTQHYLARNARHLQVSLSDVAYNNVKKIGDRQRRGVIEGEGDNR
jgi:hypothetical protein